MSHVFCAILQNSWVKYFIKMLDFVSANRSISFNIFCDWWCYKNNKILYMIKKIIESIHFENSNDSSNSSLQQKKMCIIRDRAIVKIKCTATYNHYLMHNAFFKTYRCFNCKMKHFMHKYEVHAIAIWMYRQNRTLIIYYVSKNIF
jgi:hypothetical protein